MMNISKMIKQLEEAKRQYGDLPMTTYGGFIESVKLTPAKDGVCYPLEKGEQNEIGIEIMN